MMPNGQLSGHHNMRVGDPAFFGNLDPSQASQLAALSAAGHSRIAATGRNVGSLSDTFLGGMHDPHPQPPNSSMSGPTTPAGMRMPQNARNMSGGPPAAFRFLSGLGNIMQKRNTPLPPQITGVATPSYDPHTSQFKIIELSPEIGHFRLGGRDIDLFKLWSATISSGGSSQCNWQNLASQFGLPDELPQPHGTGTVSSVRALQACYDLILGPFEELYKRNMQEQHKRAGLSSKQPMAQPGTPNRPNALGVGLPSQPPRGPGPSTPNTPFPPGAQSLAARPQSSDNVLEDMQGMKRKLDSEDTDQKRARQKTASEPRDDSSTVGSGSGPKRMQPVRRKIEYVPVAREVETYGGRDMKPVESEIAPVLGRDRPLKEMNEWGTIETDALIMSIRSRISTEMSYALTTLAILSTMKGQAPGSGFPIGQCGDLFDELLDLVEDLAFEGVADKFELNDSGLAIITHSKLMHAIHDAESQPFSLRRRQGDADRSHGLRQRPGTTILMVLTIIRNLTVIHDNNDYIVRQTRLADILLRLCIVYDRDGEMVPFSPVLSLSDVINARKDTLIIISCIAPHIIFANPTAPAMGTMKTATRMFQLVASYLVDPMEAISPSSYIQLMGAPNHAPPVLADLALDVFTRLGHLDSNRQVFSKTIPSATITQFMTSLVRRLPVLDVDFIVLGRESWLAYLEKLVMSIYTVAFLVPPALKLKIKTDRNLGLKGIFMRMMQKFLMHPNPETRSWYLVAARRCIETLKVLDDGEDSFDTSKVVAPTMAFGMGWGDSTDGEVEQGTGLLAGYRSLAWEILLQQDVFGDSVMFNELESLARVECAV